MNSSEYTVALTPGFNSNHRLLRASFEDGDLPLIPVELTASEKLSNPFDYKLRCLASELRENFTEELLGKAVTMTLKDALQPERHFHGYISHVIETLEGATFSIDITIKPWLHAYSMMRDSRTFHDKTAVEIIQTLFEEHQFHDYKLNLSQQYQKIKYYAQYDENTLDFIHRLLKEEGIFYYFSSTEQKHTLILTDNSSRLPEYKKSIKCCDQDPTQLLLYDFKNGFRVTPVHTIRSISRDPLNPTNKIIGEYTFTLCPALDAKLADSSFHHNRWTTQAEHDAAAKRAVKGYESKTSFFSGKSNIFALSAGLVVTLYDPDFPDIDGDYFIEAITHHVHDFSQLQNAKCKHNSPMGYYSDIIEGGLMEWPHTVIPPQLQLPPLRKLDIKAGQTDDEFEQAYLDYQESLKQPWKNPDLLKIPGLDCGFVTEVGENDRANQVKVRFVWDRTEQSTWLHVSHQQAGDQMGHVFIPRVGDEVLVQYYDGDPNVGIVVGSVYNGRNLPPFDLPIERYKSGIKTQPMGNKDTQAGHHIMLDDTPNQERLSLKSEQDMMIHAKGDLTQAIESDYTQTAKKGIHVHAGDHAVFTSGVGIHIKGGDSSIHIEPDKITLRGQQIHLDEAESDGSGQTATSINDPIMAAAPAQYMSSEQHKKNQDDIYVPVIPRWDNRIYHQGKREAVINPVAIDHTDIARLPKALREKIHNVLLRRDNLQAYQKPWLDYLTGANQASLVEEIKSTLNIKNMPALRDGWLYIYKDGSLWQEYQVRGQNYYPTDLAKTAGQDSRAASADGEGILNLPYLVDHKHPKLQICFSENQWSWPRVNFYGGMDKSDKRLKGNTFVYYPNKGNQIAAEQKIDTSKFGSPVQRRQKRMGNSLNLKPFAEHTTTPYQAVEPLIPREKGDLPLLMLQDPLRLIEETIEDLSDAKQQLHTLTHDTLKGDHAKTAALIAKCFSTANKGNHDFESINSITPTVGGPFATGMVMDEAFSRNEHYSNKYNATADSVNWEAINKTLKVTEQRQWRNHIRCLQQRLVSLLQVDQAGIVLKDLMTSKEASNSLADHLTQQYTAAPVVTQQAMPYSLAVQDIYASDYLQYLNVYVIWQNIIALLSDDPARIDATLQQKVDLPRAQQTIGHAWILSLFDQRHPSHGGLFPNEQQIKAIESDQQFNQSVKTDDDHNSGYGLFRPIAFGITASTKVAHANAEALSEVMLTYMEYTAKAWEHANPQIKITIPKLFQSLMHASGDSESRQHYLITNQGKLKHYHFEIINSEEAPLSGYEKDRLKRWNENDIKRATREVKQEYSSAGKPLDQTSFKAAVNQRLEQMANEKSAKLQKGYAGSNASLQSESANTATPIKVFKVMEQNADGSERTLGVLNPRMLKDHRPDHIQAANLNLVGEADEPNTMSKLARVGMTRFACVTLIGFNVFGVYESVRELKEQQSTFLSYAKFFESLMATAYSIRLVSKSFDVDEPLLKVFENSRGVIKEVYDTATEVLKVKLTPLGLAGTVAGILEFGISINELIEDITEHHSKNVLADVIQLAGVAFNTAGTLAEMALPGSALAELTPLAWVGAVIMVVSELLKSLHAAQDIKPLLKWLDYTPFAQYSEPKAQPYTDTAACQHLIDLLLKPVITSTFSANKINVLVTFPYYAPHATQYQLITDIMMMASDASRSGHDHYILDNTTLVPQFSTALQLYVLHMAFDKPKAKLIEDHTIMAMPTYISTQLNIKLQLKVQIDSTTYGQFNLPLAKTTTEPDDKQKSEQTNNPEFYTYEQTYSL